MKKAVQHYFDTHPESNECFETSDGFIFHGREMATSHSFSLGDKNVQEYKRSDIESDLVKEDISQIQKSIDESKAITDAKDAEVLHSVAAGKLQQRAEDEVSEVAEETVKAAIDENAKDMPKGTDKAEDKNQQSKNAAAVAGDAAAVSNADKVKTNVTSPDK